MPPRKAPRPAAELPASEHMDRLAAAFETIAAEVKMIRESIDRLVDDFDWALNNGHFKRDESMQIPHESMQLPPLTSMPLDPLAKDWKVNRYSAADLPDGETGKKQPSQGQLW